MRKKSYINLAEIVAVLTILCVLSPLFMAAEYNFTGIWLGRIGGVTPSAALTPKSEGDGRPGDLGYACSSGCGHTITLRVASVNKGTAKGKLTISGVNEDIREAKVMGNKLTFKTGKSPAPINDYEAVLNGENLTVTLTLQAGRPETFTMSRVK